MSLAEAVERSIAALESGRGPDALDLGIAELARMFARELDGVRAVSARADRALTIAQDTCPESETLIEHLESLRAKLAERTALDRIGARLLAAFVELGATPKARRATAAPVAPAKDGPLGQLRGIAGGLTSG